MKDLEDMLDATLYWLDRLSPDFKVLMLTLLLGGAVLGALGWFA